MDVLKAIIMRKKVWLTLSMHAYTVLYSQPDSIHPKFWFFFMHDAKETAIFFFNFIVSNLTNVLYFK